MSMLTVIGGTPEQIQKCFERYHKEEEIRKKSQKSTTTSKPKANIGFYVGKKLRKFRQKKSGHNYRKKKAKKSMKK